MADGGAPCAVEQLTLVASDPTVDNLRARLAEARRERDALAQALAAAEARVDALRRQLRRAAAQARRVQATMTQEGILL